MRRASQWTAAVVAVAVVMLASSCEWRFARFDAAHTGTSTNETILGLGNVAGLGEEWSSTSTGPHPVPPIVVGSSVFVLAGGTLSAYAIDGGDLCTGTPATCAPTWTAPLWTSGVSAHGLFVADGRIVAVGPPGTMQFDPAGIEGCGGTPRVCQPIGSSPQPTHPAVASGTELYGTGPLNATTAEIPAAAFSAASCSSPALCAPLRTYEPDCSFLQWCTAEFTSISGTDLVVSSSGELLSHTGVVGTYDRTGANGCTGSPARCQPRWETQVGNPTFPPVISEATIYQAAIESCATPEECSLRRFLTALDLATGAVLWTRATPSSFRGLAATGGWLHEAHAAEVRSYPDARTCGNCSPHHRSTPNGTATISAEPVLANGLLIVGTTDGVDVFDAAGAQGCTSTPITCSPIAHVGGFAVRHLSVALGNVWATDSTGRLHVLGLD